MKHEANLKTLGGRLRWLRMEHGLTLEQFGEKIKVGRSYLSKLENGKAQNTSEQFLFVVCDVFDLCWDWLEKGEGVPYLPQAERVTTIGKKDVTSIRLQLMGTSFEEMIQVLPQRVEAMLSACPPELRPDLFEKINNLLRDFVRLHDQQFQTFAQQLVDSKGIEKSAVDNVSDVVNIEAVKPQLPSLLKRLEIATSQRGQKSELAKFLGVSLVQVSQWLTGDREPSGETTLKLLHWVEQQERQK
jgi:transcriptional regulator with XRE-family HTH domain